MPKYTVNANPHPTWEVFAKRVSEMHRSGASSYNQFRMFGRRYLVFRHSANTVVVVKYWPETRSASVQVRFCPSLRRGLILVVLGVLIFGLFSLGVDLYNYWNTGKPEATGLGEIIGEFVQRPDSFLVSK